MNLHPSIFCIADPIPGRARRRISQRTRGTSHCRAHSDAHSHTRNNLEMPISTKHVSLERTPKPVLWEETPMKTLATNTADSGFEPSTTEVWDKHARNWTFNKKCEDGQPQCAEPYRWAHLFKTSSICRELTRDQSSHRTEVLSRTTLCTLTSLSLTPERLRVILMDTFADPAVHHHISSPCVLDHRNDVQCCRRASWVLQFAVLCLLIAQRVRIAIIPVICSVAWQHTLFLDQAVSRVVGYWYRNFSGIVSTTD